MKRQSVAELTSVIRANTERRTLEELAAKGKRHFRVVSGEKVMELIQAVVDDAIEREAGEIAAQDRDRIVAETRRDFDRVLRIQSEQDAAIRRHRELADYFRQQAEKAEGRIAALKAEVEQGRHRLTLRESELLACFEQERGEIQRDCERRLAEGREAFERSEVRLANARETIENYDREFQRLTRELEAERDRLTAALAAGPDLSRARDQVSKVTIRGLQQEVRALARRLGAAQGALAAARRELATRADAAAPEVVRGVAELREMVREIADRPVGLDADSLGQIVERIAERDGKAAAELEARFRDQMEETLTHVTKALRLATAKPVDFAVEATDVLIDRLFDHEDEMGTNLGALAVEELAAGPDIAGNLERLRAARGQREDDTKSGT